MGTISGKKFKIVRAKLSEQIADRLEDIILGEELEDNEKLPPEQTLAENFNVSKNVVRESLNILKERGLVETRNGSGNYVTRPKADNLSDVIGRMVVLNNIDYEQIYDTRMILETSACHRAAKRITSKELAKLERIQKRLEDKSLSVQKRREVDLDFHIVIAKASGNNLLVVLIQAMRNNFLDFMFLQKDIEEWDSIDESIQFHHRILAALREHDAGGAEKAMYDHLHTAMKNIERVVNEKQETEPEEEQKMNIK